MPSKEENLLVNVGYETVLFGLIGNKKGTLKIYNDRIEMGSLLYKQNYLPDDIMEIEIKKWLGLFRMVRINFANGKKVTLALRTWSKKSFNNVHDTLLNFVNSN